MSAGIEEHDAAAASLSPGPSLRTRAISGTAWAMTGFGFGQVLRFATNLVLTRLIAPEIFGLMALSGALLQGLGMFSDLGVNQAVTQSARGDERRVLGTARTIAAARGAAITLLATLLAPAAASFYEQPELLWIIPLASLTALIDGVSSTKLFLLTKRLELWRLTLIDATTQVVGVGVILAWASVRPEVAALIAGSLAASLTRCLLSYLAVPGRTVPPSWDGGAARHLMHFGRWIFLSTLITFFAIQCDRLFFGKVVSMAELGVYNIGATLAMMPSMALGHLALAVVFPLYSQMLARGERTWRALATVRPPILCAAGWMLGLLVAAGPSLIEILYAEAYQDAGWIVRIIAVGAWFIVLEATLGAALLASGRASWVAAANFGKLVAFAVLVPFAIAQFGFHGAVVAVACAETAKYVVATLAALRLGFRNASMEAAFTAYAAVSVVVALFASRSAAAHGPAAVVAVAFGVLTVLWLAPAGWSLRRFRSMGAGEASS